MRVISSSFLFAIVVAMVAALCCASSAFLVQAQTSAAVLDELTKNENALSVIADTLENLEQTRCSRLSSWTLAGSGCSQPGAGNNFEGTNGFTCVENLGSDKDLCGGNCKGLVRSETKSTTLFPEQTSNDNKNVQGFLAINKQVEAAMKAQRTGGNISSWMGYGDQTTGQSHWFPGFPRERRSPFESRQRPWYIAASKGPSDIVLILDVSGSMDITDSGAAKSRLALMKEAVVKLLDTMSLGDFFAIVTFSGSNTGKIITSGTRLLRATQANRDTAKTLVRNLFADGGTDFRTGYEKAFNVFRDSTEVTSNCARVILHLTDGDAFDKTTINSYITSQMSTSGISSNKPYIMTFTMSSGAAQQPMKDIACAFNGIHSHIGNGVNPFNAMAGYYKFLALGLDATSTKPRWSEKYIDAFGLGELTTVSRPIYDRSKSYPVFVGVASVDVKYSSLTALASESQVVASLSTRTSTCPTYNVTKCQLQLLRAESTGACPSPEPTVAACTPLIEEGVNCSTVSGVSGGANAMLCESLDFNNMIAAAGAKPYDEVACCESCALSTGAIVGIAVGALAGVAIIGAIVYLVAFKGGSSAAAAGGASSAGASGFSASPPPAQGPAPSYPPQPSYGNQPPPQQYNNQPPSQYGNHTQPQYHHGNANVAYGQPAPGGYGQPGPSYPSASQYA